jgi:hypothetical protein
MKPGIQQEITFAEPDARAGSEFEGPFLFCDYWASVLELGGIVNDRALSRMGLSLEIFRKILDRPSAGLPRLGYFILATLLKPVIVLARVVLRLAGWRPRPRPRRNDQSAMREVLLKHALDVRPSDDGDADVYLEGEKVAGGLVNPYRLRASASLFFARYKVFLGAGVALGYGALIGPIAALFGHGNVLVPYLGALFYPVVLLILWVMFDDLLTATVAPLPLIALSYIVRIGHGFKGFVIAVVLIGLILYLVEWFFIPRSLPPALYLYVNDPASRFFPYKSGHEPYWLKGKYYWVWRVVNLAPAELIKFWEKDWERLEVWVRAEGEGKGRIEWIVNDWHYRELWFEYDVFTRQGARLIHDQILRADLASGRPLTWVVEVDMDLVFHSPAVRGIYLAQGTSPSFMRRVISIFGAILRKRAKDKPEKYAENMELFEIQGGRLLHDIPEHFRMASVRRLLSMPWTYWRFPHGANATRKAYVYGDTGGAATGPDPASDRKFQIKRPG